MNFLDSYHQFYEDEQIKDIISINYNQNTNCLTRILKNTIQTRDFVFRYYKFNFHSKPDFISKKSIGWNFNNYKIHCTEELIFIVDTNHKNYLSQEEFREVYYRDKYHNFNEILKLDIFPVFTILGFCDIRRHLAENEIHLYSKTINKKYKLYI